MTDPTPNLTPQQDVAVNRHGVSIALSAGAGCGKTFVLTQRFLSLLQPGAKPVFGDPTSDPLGGIVAITFTERAAREMRDRIRAACHQRLTHCSSDEVDHWLKIIRALDSARISTIHAFCASLLRSHAVEAGIDPHFGLLDQALGTAFLRQTVSDAIFELVVADDPHCRELVLHYGLERTVELMRSLLPGRFQIHFDRFDHDSHTTLAEAWSLRWRQHFIPHLLSGLVESESTRRLLDLLAAHEPTHAKMQERRSLLLANMSDLTSTGDPLSLLADLSTAARVQGGGGKDVWPSVDIYEQIKEAFSTFRANVKKLTEKLNIEPDDVETAAKFSHTALHVIRRVCEKYELRKQEAGLLDFDDLLLCARNLLRDNEQVRRRASSGIQYLMVDEFQDTDPVQSEIVRHLCGAEMLSGKLFLVGDAKQSIYRFRRADPAVFAALRGEIPPAGQLPLSTNFRSQPAILHFVNCLFAAEMGAGYEALTPHTDEQLTPTPAIEFLFAPPDPVQSEPKENAEQLRTREADWIARRIASLLNDEVPRVRQLNPESGKPTLRPAGPGDIAILFRSLSHVALYEEALRKYDLPYYLVGGRAFYAQQEVYDLVNLCSFLDNHDDQVSLAGVLRSPFFGLNDDTLFAMVDEAGSLAEALGREPAAQLNEDQQRQWKYAADVLRELLDKKEALPLAGLLNLAIERTGYDAMLLTEFLGRRKLANLHKLIGMARQFDSSGLYTISDFVARMRDSITEQSDEELAATQAESSDVIRLMTIHQSKGLEFPIVVVADLNSGRYRGGENAYFHPEFGPLISLPKVRGKSISHLGWEMHKLAEETEDAAETTRLLYVACTRAADILILSAGMNAARKAVSPWMRLLAKRFDITTGLPQGDPYLGRLSLGDVSPEEIPEIRVHQVIPAFDRPQGSEKKRDLRLDQIRETIESAEAGILPETLESIPPDPTTRRRFSVSEIEQAAREADSSGSVHPRNGAATSREQSLVDSTQLGTVVHEILERIDWERPEELDRLIELCLRTLGDSANEALRAAALNRLRGFVVTALYQELRQSRQCYRELDFLLTWPIEEPSEQSITISGQIDCLFQTADEKWKIIDYKTGRGGTAAHPDLLAKYDIQLALYALATQTMIGRLPESIELVLLGDLVERVPLVFSDSFLAGVTHKINTAIQRLRTGEPSKA